MAHERHVEVVEVLDHPASDKAPFGQAVRARSEAGGGWLGWVVRVDDIKPYEVRLGRESAEGNRRPDGTELSGASWVSRAYLRPPALPFFVEWRTPECHPSVGAHTEVTIEGLQIAGRPGPGAGGSTCPPTGPRR